MSEKPLVEFFVVVVFQCHGLKILPHLGHHMSIKNLHHPLFLL